MPARIEGYITIDASDYTDELEIHADAYDIAQIMDYNEVSIESLMQEFDIKQQAEITLEDVDRYIQEEADHEDIAGIVSVCIKRLTSDYSITFNQMVESRRALDQARAEAKVLTGGPHVSEIRPSS